MQENFIHILSSSPSEISLNGVNIGTIDNINTMELDFFSNTNKVYINYMPISYKTNYLPYSVQLNTQNVVSCQNSLVNVIPFTDNNYDVILNPFEYNNATQTEVVLNKNLGKYFLSITNNSTCTLQIFAGASLIFSLSLPTLSNAKADLNKNILIVEGIIDADNYYLLVLNTDNFEVLFNDIVQSIDATTTSITTYQNILDISHHAVVCKIDFSTQKSQKYYVYQNNICTQALHPMLIPMDFLECVKIGDESKIKSLLSNNLISHDLSQFQSYFGDIKKIYLNRHQCLSSKINYTILSDSYKNYNFLMQGNKIVDIEDVF